MQKVARNTRSCQKKCQVTCVKMNSHIAILSLPEKCGPPGIMGTKGEPGLVGMKGERGIAGNQGRKGEKGEKEKIAKAGQASLVQQTNWKQ